MTIVAFVVNVQTDPLKVGDHGHGASGAFKALLVALTAGARSACKVI